MLYFSYGSNLSSENLKSLNLNLKKIRNYLLKDYQLVFREPYGDPDIEEKKGNFVNGVLYFINSRDEKVLDVYEEYPKYYLKKYNTNPNFMFYQMKDKTKPTKPNQNILTHILHGYKEHGFDTRFLRNLKN